MSRKQEETVMINSKVLAIIIILLAVVVIVFVNVSGILSNGCNSDLVAALRQGISDELPLPSYGLFCFSGTKRTVVFEESVCFDCEKGSLNGENVNFYYCEGSSGDSTIYNYQPIQAYQVFTDENGNILKRVNYKANVRVEIDPTDNMRIVNLICNNV